MSTTHSGSVNPTDLPNGWRETDDDRWRHHCGAIVRIHSNIPLRSASDCNTARHSDAKTTFEVLYHDKPLPSRPDEVASLESKEAARERALETMRARP